jgi:hypothetical protein
MRRWSDAGIHDPKKERFLRRPCGSEGLAENWPVVGSKIPEEPSLEVEAEGEEVLAGVSEELVSVGWALSVLVEVSGGRSVLAVISEELVSVGWALSVLV